MKYYIVAELKITDTAWIRQYVVDVTRLVEQHGGRYLARTNVIEKIEGDRAQPEVFLLTEWLSREIAKAFYTSDEYRPYLEARLRGSNSEFLLVAGDDVNDAATITR